MKVILLGAPGAGKGTQAEVISDRYSIPIIGTGNLIREALKEGNSLSEEIQLYMDSGKLVPDEIVLELLEKRISLSDTENGYILDGFPRTISQADALEKMGCDIDKVISIEISDEEIIRRLSGRRICGECGSSYHMEYKKPKVDNICDRCGGKLIMRKDDNPDVIKARLQTYHEQTKPLKEYYQNKGKIYFVESQEEVADTTKLTLAILEA